MTQEEKALKKILKYQYDFDEYTLKLIASRLNSTRGLGLVDLFDIAYFSMVYAIMVQIEKEMSLTRRHQVNELENLLNQSAKTAYNSMKPLYADGGKEFVPYKDNKEVRDTAIRETDAKVRQFNDVLRGVGYSLTDSKTDKKTFNSPSETYQKISNEAKQQELNNPFGYDLWSRKVTKELLRDGLKIYNYNQDTHRYKQQSSYSFIRNFVKNAVYSVCQNVYNAVANQVGIDGVEISVHMDCAIDHLPIQGHQFDLANFKKMQSNDDFVDIDGRHFSGLDRAIGTLNCRHFVYPIILGKTQPRYTEKQLQEIKNRNEKYVQTELSNGDNITMSYNEYKQKLNILENKLTTLTLDLHVAEKLGDKWLIEYYKSRISTCKNEISVYKSLL